MPDGRQIITTQDERWRRADPSESDFQLADSPFYWLARVAGRYQLEMDAVLKAVGMDVPRWRVLVILQESQPASISQICERAVVKMSTMTRIVQRLAAAGMVVARPYQADARVTEVFLTEAGNCAAQLVRTQAGHIYRKAFAEVSGEECEQLTVLLRQLFANLRTTDDHATHDLSVG